MKFKKNTLSEKTVKEFDEFFGLLSDEPTFSFEKNIKDLVETSFLRI